MTEYDEYYSDDDSLEYNQLCSMHVKNNSYENKQELINNLPINSNNEENREKNNNFGYNPYEFVSKCCKAFVFYDKLNVYCSKCGKLVDTIKESLPINIKFNTNTEKIIISGDMLKTFHNSIPRFATDPTYELCETKCPKCNSKMRYLRDYNDKLCFVCSNKDCRNVIV